ncbi:MAG: phosphoesterase [Pseudomonadota bacterium]|nr:phosphoesterase [Pseudomonadota bacterium]
MNTKLRSTLLTGIVAATFAGTALPAEGPVPRGVPHLDHVFLIMMENHAYGQVIGNPNMPYLNRYANTANLATRYFAVGHPSLTNYLEIVGGSNFGVRNDHAPNWHNGSCVPNLKNGVVSLESVAAAICPIQGVGTDAATPALDCTNESTGNQSTGVGCSFDIDGKMSVPAARNVSGKTIADQLVEYGLSWKSYQESLPPGGADYVNSADGLFSNLSLTPVPPVPPATSSTVSKFSIPVLGGDETGAVNGTLQSLYAVKHNPFAYFASIQEGDDSRNGLQNIVGFGGPHGLFEDLVHGQVPNLVFIAPNQCHDQHGRNGATAGPECDYDPNDNGTLVGLNPALMYEGDQELEQLVTAIKTSPTWKRGNSALVIVWDENDYSVNPTTNQVALLVDTNDQDGYGIKSDRFYTHFSLLKTMEASFGLPCLNHACDSDTEVMTDLFRRH